MEAAVSHKSHKQFHQSVWQYFCQFVRPYSWYAGAAGSLLIVNAFIILGLGYVLRHYVDTGLTAQNFAFLNFSYVACLAIAFIFAAAAFARILLTGWLGEKIIADIKISLFAHILTFDRQLYDQLKMAEIVENFHTGSGYIQTCLSHAFATLLRSIFQVVGATILLWFTSPKLTLLTFLIVPIVIFPIRILSKFIRNRTDQVQASQATVSSFISECFNGLVDIQLFQNESHILCDFKKIMGSFLDITSKRLILRSFLIAMVIFLLFTAIITVIWIGSHDVLTAKMSAGSLTSFVFYAVVVGGSLNQITELYGDVQNALNAFERIVTVLQLRPYQVHQPYHHDDTTRASCTIHFENISFCYPTRVNHQILDHVSMTIPQGQQVAIVGPSGAGKSTLFQLLTRSYIPNQGRILINETCLSDMHITAVRNLFSIVSQNPFLFEASIYNNIAFGDKSASFAHIMQAAEHAGVIEFVQQLPRGFDTVLGGSGLQLSQGQRQRLAIARALLRSAPILLMDEATNALDSVSEKIIQNVLERIKGKKTVLIIAHRLSTVINTDHIIVLDQGKVIEQGVHQQLINKDGLYRRLAENQFFSLS